MFHGVIQKMTLAQFFLRHGVVRRRDVLLKIRPPNFPFPASQGPHLTQCAVVGPHKCTCQMASKSVERFKQGDDDDDERMNFNVAKVLRLQGHVTRKNNSEITW